MKKTIAKVAGAFVLAASMLLASCSEDGTSSFNSEIDTILNLSAPVVKATAYPGMNYVSWSPVANANGYVVYKYEDDHFIKSTSTSTADAESYTVLEYVDTDIRNGSKYKYYVEATSKTSTGRAVVTENTMSDPVTVTAIVPATSTKSL